MGEEQTVIFPMRQSGLCETGRALVQRVTCAGSLSASVNNGHLSQPLSGYWWTSDSSAYSAWAGGGGLPG
jgi:hypothetical protein